MSNQPMMRAKTSEWEITEAMIIYGGSFVQGLGRLWRQADSDNKRKLLTAFRDYFEKYDELAALKLIQPAPPDAKETP
jgi:hypothetical protein